MRFDVHGKQFPDAHSYVLELELLFGILGCTYKGKLD